MLSLQSRHGFLNVVEGNHKHKEYYWAPLLGSLFCYLKKFLECFLQYCFKASNLQIPYTIGCLLSYIFFFKYELHSCWIKHFSWGTNLVEFVSYISIFFWLIESHLISSHFNLAALIFFCIFVFCNSDQNVSGIFVTEILLWPFMSLLFGCLYSSTLEYSFCILAHTRQCSGFTPSSALRIYSWQGSGDRMRCSPSNPEHAGWLHASKQAPYMLYCHSRPNSGKLLTMISLTIRASFISS